MCLLCLQWDQVVGLQDAKDELHMAVSMPTMVPHLYAGLSAPTSGILLYGPPGTGKTFLAKVCLLCLLSVLRMQGRAVCYKQHCLSVLLTFPATVAQAAY